MRLIDADAIRERLSKKLNSETVTGYGKGFVHGALSVLNSEGIDAKPVIHAKWIKYENHIYDEYYYSCSACDNDWVCIEGSPEDNNMNYCPYCGAKMDGEA